MGLTRSNKWGKSNTLLTKAPILIAQIESKRGVDNLKEIAKFNFDFYLIGPYDLSASIGEPGEFNSYKFRSKLQRICDIISKKKLGVHIPNKVEEQFYKYKDYGLLALGMDTTLLIEGLIRLENC